MDKSIETILSLKFLPIADFETIKNSRAFVETLLNQGVSVLQINFKDAGQIKQSGFLEDIAKEFPEMSVGAGFFYSTKDAEIVIKNGAVCIWKESA